MRTHNAHEQAGNPARRPCLRCVVPFVRAHGGLVYYFMTSPLALRSCRAHCSRPSAAARRRPRRVGTPGHPGAPLTEPDLWASHPALRKLSELQRELRRADDEFGMNYRPFIFERDESPLLETSDRHRLQHER